ncbi:hypothetical protein RB195_023624 [Necator americanus]|uniref:Uncharacterized protein n=1 Tax=Necator americanus TaxID=51031 RepID=A0ABR1EJZ7_NECAM
MASSSTGQHETPAETDSCWSSIVPTQRERLRKCGRRALCVDDTSNLTSYSLTLATVIVADEWHIALPTAYLLSCRASNGSHDHIPARTKDGRRHSKVCEDERKEEEEER